MNGRHAPPSYTGDSVPVGHFLVPRPAGSGPRAQVGHRFYSRFETECEGTVQRPLFLEDVRVCRRQTHTDVSRCCYGFIENASQSLRRTSQFSSPAPSDLSSRFVGNEGETRETARRRASRVEMPRDRARGGTAGLRARLLPLKANPGVRNAHSWRTGRASCTIPIIFLKDVTETRLRDGTGKSSGRSPLAGCRKAPPSWRGLLVD